MSSKRSPVVDSPAARIADVERLTGVPRATLRIWERRYGFPAPRRDARGERFYRDEDVDKLRLVGQLTARGRRPGALVALPTRELRKLVTQARDAAVTGDPLVQLVARHDPAELQHHLLQQLAALGLERLVCEVLPRCNQRIGDAWACGELEVFEEHMYTDTVEQVLRSALAALPLAFPGRQPRVVLASPSGELHVLGLLMVRALLGMEGCPCMLLGPNTPVDQIARAAAAFDADIVAVSFASGTRRAEVVNAVTRLVERMPAQELWVGGGGAVAGGPARHFASLGEVRPAVADWRARHQAK